MFISQQQLKSIESRLSESSLDSKLSFWNTREQYIGEDDPYYFTVEELLRGIIRHLDVVPVHVSEQKYVKFEKHQIPKEVKEEGD